MGGASNDELARRLSADLARFRRPPSSADQAPITKEPGSNDDLVSALGADVARLRRLHASGTPAQATQTPNAEFDVEAALEATPAVEAEGTIDEGDTPIPQEMHIQAHPVRDPGVLTDTERRALFIALSDGTERRLGRKPTALEFVRLCDALVMARQLAMVERHLFYGGMEIHWNGTEWAVEDASKVDDLQAAIQTWAEAV